MSRKRKVIEFTVKFGQDGQMHAPLSINHETTKGVRDHAMHCLLRAVVTVAHQWGMPNPLANLAEQTEAAKGSTEVADNRGGRT